jgi:hypothetical protein
VSDAISPGTSLRINRVIRLGETEFEAIGARKSGRAGPSATFSAFPAGVPHAAALGDVERFD